jgi:hypothetical protein
VYLCIPRRRREQLCFRLYSKCHRLFSKALICLSMSSTLYVQFNLAWKASMDGMGMGILPRSCSEIFALDTVTSVQLR